MRVVYIASPYTIGGTQENVDRQRKMAHRLMDLGYAVVWPLSSHYLEMYRSRSYGDWMAMDFELIGRCDALLRLPGASYGADAEVLHARSLHLPVVFSVDELVALP